MEPPRPSLAEPFIGVGMESPGPSPSPWKLTSPSIDLVMLFPYHIEDEKKHPERYTLEKFIKRMLGLRHGKFNGREKVNDLKAVFRTAKCYLDDSGHPFIAPLSNATIMTENASNEEDTMLQIEIDRKNACLTAEYVAFVGNAQPTTSSKFCELVVRTMAKRLQLTCGLTVKMFKSKNGDSIIMTVKADEGDLKTEAERSSYRLQVSNKPFDAIHASKLNTIQGEYGEMCLAEARTHLSMATMTAQDRVLSPRHQKSLDDVSPEIDPWLISHGETHQTKLHVALLRWGHNELADGRYPPPALSIARSKWEQFKSALVCISSDPSSYFSLYTPYKSDSKLQPLFRRFPSANGLSLFRSIDRIRLCSSIINRHLNLQALRDSGYLLDTFALHDTATLESLKRKWALNKGMTTQPIGEIREYFGEKVALYFVWLEFYTKMLVLPAIAGTVIYLLDVFTDVKSQKLKIAFAVAIVIWSTLFTELWKRKSAIYNVLWGADESDIQATPRTQFVGIKRMHPIDNSLQMWVKNTSRARCRIRTSLLVVFLMVLIVIVALTGLFYLKHLSSQLESPQQKQWAAIGVSALNSIQINVLNMAYRSVANVLNHWENHRTDVDFENHLITKVFLFQFCNSFASFFYIAYVKNYVGDACVNNNCLSELRLQLFILFGMQVFVGNFVEIVIPHVTQLVRLYLSNKSFDSTASKLKKENYSSEELQSMLAPYEASEAFQDYNEMVIQYGFVTLFVVAFPLTPLMALANNVLEIHVDSFKLCSAHRRPFPHRASDIGSWFFFLQMMNSLAVVTNICILLFTYDPSDTLTSTDTDMATKWVTLLIAEHVCLAMKYLVAYTVPDEPMELALLKARHKEIEANVFLGQNVDDASTVELSEKAESLDLVILDNKENLSLPTPPSPENPQVTLPPPPPTQLPPV